MGLNEILGRDYGIEELYWETVVIYVFIISHSVTLSLNQSHSVDGPLKPYSPDTLLYNTQHYLLYINYTCNIPIFPLIF